jgi:hypothetical protein
MLNFVENLLENERGPMNDQDLTKTDYDPDRSLVLIEGLSHFLTNFLQNLASCQTSFRKNQCHCETGFGVYRSTQLGHIPLFLLLYLLVGPSIGIRIVWEREI